MPASDLLADCKQLLAQTGRKNSNLTHSRSDAVGRAFSHTVRHRDFSRSSFLHSHRCKLQDDSRLPFCLLLLPSTSVMPWSPSSRVRRRLLRTSFLSNLCLFFHAVLVDCLGLQGGSGDSTCTASTTKMPFLDLVPPPTFCTRLQRAACDPTKGQQTGCPIQAPPFQGLSRFPFPFSLICCFFSSLVDDVSTRHWLFNHTVQLSSFSATKRKLSLRHLFVCFGGQCSLALQVWRTLCWARAWVDRAVLFLCGGSG